MALLQKATVELNITIDELIKDLVIAGDLIDRGPKSKEIVEFAIKNDIATVRGNHEQMAIDAMKNPEDFKLWTINGCDPYIQQFVDFKNMNSLFELMSLEAMCNFEELVEQIRWMNSLPYKLTFEDVLIDGRKLVVTHSSLMGKSDEILEDDNSANHLLWNRPYSIQPETGEYGNSRVEDIEGVFNVFGHTTMGKPDITEYYANIDGGAFVGEFKERYRYPESSTLGRMNLLVLPEKKVIHVDYQEE
jgi:serine/threonine protein phosphatase 1